MRKQAVQQQDAVPLLHDGTLLTQPQSGPVALLQKARVQESFDTMSVYVRLLSDLLAAQRIKDQLHTLQNFKGLIVKKKNRESNEDYERAIVALLDDCELKELQCLYHLLLEWSIGYLTPLPLRRTIHSILETIYSFHRFKNIMESIFSKTVYSICGQPSSGGSVWKEPLDSLEALLSLARIRPSPYLLSTVPPIVVYLNETSQSIQGALEASATTSNDDDTSVAKGIKVVSLAKTMLQDDRVSVTVDLGNITSLCWSLLLYCHTPAESLPIVGMAYGSTISFGTNSTECMKLVNHRVQYALEELRPLPRVCFLQGLVVAVPDDVWIRPLSVSDDALRLFQNVFGEKVRQAVDPEVRLAAIKGIRTVVSRSLTMLGNAEVGNACIPIMQQVSDACLEVTLQAWENPPTRKIGNSLPSVFQAIVDWKENLMKRSGENLFEQSSLGFLVDRLLAQPPYRKGKYKALECLLPKVGARRILIPKGTVSSINSLLTDLLAGVGDGSHNMGAMADLWAKLLQSLFADTHKFNTVKNNKKEMKKIEEPSSPPIQLSVSKDWLDAWVPSLADALVSREWKRRKHVAAFCLPKIFFMVLDRIDAAATSFGALLDHVGRLSKDLDAFQLPSKDRETSTDRVMWATMEIIRYSTMEKKLLAKKSLQTQPLIDAVAVNASIDYLREGLIHFSPTIRVTAFHAMEGVVQCICATPMDCCLCEVELWKFALPYASKTDTREYLSTILFRLLSFMDRLSRCEAESFAEKSEGSRTTLPVSGSFMAEFLVGDVLVEKSSYPDSVVAKETFGLSLLECILIFSCRDLRAAHESNILPKNGAVFVRKRSIVEEATLKYLRSTLVGPHVIRSLFSLLGSSTWDGTKAKSFESLATLILIARHEEICLPAEFFDTKASATTMERALWLASSPRQREADTGARMIALLGLSQTSFLARAKFVEDLTALLEERLKEVSRALEFVLRPDTDVRKGQEVPLVHGIVLALRLIVENDAFEIPRGSSLSLLDRVAKTLCNGMQISLAVVGDVREGEKLEGIDDEFEISTTIGDDPTRCKINPGAIGANGIFSSVSRIDAVESERRLASQRIIVGSWLLTREACAAIAVVLTVADYEPPRDIFDLAGTLLISTLTSLKHTGAAYAGHLALQMIAKAAFSRSSTSDLPINWIERLFREITSTDKIRDSTLRRSSGYALGFLSIMRSEVSLRCIPRSIGEQVMRQVLLLTLPKPSRLQDFLAKIGLPSKSTSGIFSYLEETISDSAPPKDTESIRSRVHSLNVLRMMILDAPLSREVFPIVGDAIVSAIIGYVDPNWSIRNSAGMVFSAAMLRVVDADKNAFNTDLTSKNAITLSELFQSYPALCGVLLEVLKACVNGNLKVKGGGSLPPILPILVLLYRVQPLDVCDQDVVERMQMFYPSMMACLGDGNLSVRQAAARALCNLSGGEADRPFSVASLYSQCTEDLRRPTNWNRLHGSLLLIKELRLSNRITDHDSDDVKLLIGLLKATDPDIGVPPICFVDAIHVLETVRGGNVREILAKLCFRSISWISQDSPAISRIPGVSELCSTAASAALRWLGYKIFEERAISAMGELSCLLECNIVDVRVPATKQFKKLLYDGLDSILTFSEQDSIFALKVVDALGGRIGAALAKELDRDDSGSIGAHPPTLRRLSRCLLEIEATRRRISDKSCRLPGENKLREFGLSILHRENLDRDHPVPLIGNALELLASEFHAQDTRQLWSLLVKFSQAAVPWRIRYSVACASARLWQDHKSLRPMLRYLVSRLLQDEDPDARYILVKAITGDRSSALAVSEHVLIKFIRQYESGIEDAQLFVDRLIDRTHQVLAQLHGMIQERTSDSQRKIFEAEDPNSYHEPSAEDQATLSSLWETLATAQTLASQHETLVSLATEILIVLSNRHDADTLTCTIFSTLHTLLLVTMASPANAALTDTAKCFLLKTTTTTPLHPCIETALRLLAVRSPEPLQLDRIQECLFLL